jgi:hypothetical protein
MRWARDGADLQADARPLAANGQGFVGNASAGDFQKVGAGDPLIVMGRLPCSSEGARAPAAQKKPLDRALVTPV